MTFRSGVVAVVGKPNVGKSTLVNAVVGQKVSIVSDKAQTTRRRIRGIATTDEWQIAFVDTPGYHAPHHRLGRTLNDVARQSIQDVDILLVMVDGSKSPDGADRTLAAMLRDTAMIGDSARAPVILCMNKMDLLEAKYVETNYEAYVKLFPADESMMTSCTRSHNVDLLVGLLVDRLPEGPPHFDPDIVTDMPMRFMAAELVREKALHLTRQEVPHAIATYVEDWDEDEDLLHISAVILVERNSQKGILIGKKGRMLTEIGTKARKEIEEMVGKKVFLELFVKVGEEWRQSPRMLRELDLS